MLSVYRGCLLHLLYRVQIEATVKLGKIDVDLIFS